MNKIPDWIFFPSLIAAAILGIIIASYTVTKSWEMEAIKKGHAVWITDESGHSTFKWKEPCK